MATVANAQEAVEAAVDQAVQASVQGTFAVGGALIDNSTGEVVQAMHNNVLQPYPAAPPGGFMLHDPTAHGERQLVDWYYGPTAPDGLPAPSDLTVVTSLDPCAMCAGALLTAGFNVAVSALDDRAGINYDGRLDFPSLTPALRSQAQATFAYYGVTGPLQRPYAGGTGPVFAGESIDSKIADLSGLVFYTGADAVRAISSGSGIAPSAMKDPVDLPVDSPVRLALEGLYAETLTVRSAAARFPGPEIAQPLMTVAEQAKQSGAAYNAVAIIDPFGNLLACVGGAENKSPIRTAFMEATRMYAGLRWALGNSPDPDVQAAARTTLTHAMYCTFVHLVAPDPTTPEALMALGAYGSTMEAPPAQAFPSPLQYVHPPAGVAPIDIARLAASLPPLYVDTMGVAPEQVLDSALITATS